MKRQPSSLSSDELLVSVKKAWGDTAKIPGLPLKERQHRMVLLGGPIFWFFYFIVVMVGYMLLTWYALLVILVRVAFAALLSLFWLGAKGVEYLQRRWSDRL